MFAIFFTLWNPSVFSMDFLMTGGRSFPFSACVLLCRTGVWQRSDPPSVSVMPVACSNHAKQRALSATSRIFPFFLTHISSLAHFLFFGLASWLSRSHPTFYLLFLTKLLDYLWPIRLAPVCITGLKLTFTPPITEQSKCGQTLLGSLNSMAISWGSFSFVPDTVISSFSLTLWLPQRYWLC